MSKYYKYSSTGKKYLSTVHKYGNFLYLSTSIQVLGKYFSTYLSTILLTYSSTLVQGHPRSSILVIIESAYVVSLYLLIVTLDLSRTIFEILTFFLENSSFSPSHPCLTPLVVCRSLSVRNVLWLNGAQVTIDSL